MIKFDNVSKKYGANTIVSDISFEVNKGELTVLIGPSGCGKTTLLKIINRLIEPSSGTLYINGEDILQKNEIELRRNIGYVIQQTGLFPHMTVRENIEIISRLQGKNKDDIAKKSVELMEMVGLDYEMYFDRYPSQLSGGQQQRVGVARAFACDPDIILMDEPFSALDPMTRVQLQDELAELQEKVKKTIVFVTHDMDEAVKIADRICLLNDGKIIQYDTVEDIMKNPADEFVADFIGRNRIWSSPEYIKAKDIMIPKPVCAQPDATISRCLEKMRRYKIDTVLITDKQMKMQGIVFAKELRQHQNKETAVSEVMSKEFNRIFPDDNIVDILQNLNSEGFTPLPVVDGNNTLRGLITKGSLLTTLSYQYLDPPVEVV